MIHLLILGWLICHTIYWELHFFVISQIFIINNGLNNELLFDYFHLMRSNVFIANYMIFLLQSVMHWNAFRSTEQDFQVFIIILLHKGAVTNFCHRNRSLRVPSFQSTAFRLCSVSRRLICSTSSLSFFLGSLRNPVLYIQQVALRCGPSNSTFYVWSMASISSNWWHSTSLRCW